MASSIDGSNRGQSELVGKRGTPLAANSNEPGVVLTNRRLIALRAYAATLVAAALSFAISMLVVGQGVGLLIPTAAMALAALVTEKQSVRMNPHLELSAAFLPALFSAAVLGPISAIIVGFVSLLADCGRPWERWLIWSSSRCLTLGIASYVASLFGSTRTLSGIFTAVTVTSVIVLIGESSIGSLTIWIRNVANPLSQLRYAVMFMSVGLMIYIPIIAGLAYVYRAVSPWAVVLFVAPVVAAQRYFFLYHEQMQTAGELATAVSRLERVNLSFATALVTALDTRDHYTAGHSAAVAIYARDIARVINLPEHLVRQSHICGLLHDIGKIGVPTGALRKRGPLTRDERSAIESHTTVGASILQRIEQYEEVAKIVLHHHERYDGKGYPKGISGDDIPLISRIVAVADAYSAMTSERPYRTALSAQEAQDRLRQEAGKQFDPSIVAALLSVLEVANEEYTRSSNRDFEAEITELMDTAPKARVPVYG